MTTVAPFVELLGPHEATPANPRWHELRRSGVSASEIAAVLGLSPWESPFSLYWAKVNDWRHDENPEMSAGRRAEQVIADWYAEEADPLENLLIQPAGLYASTERPWQLATPDRLLCRRDLCGSCDAGLPTICSCGDDLIGLLECKYLVQGWDGWGADGSDEIPVYYRAQALWQLDVLGVDDVHVAAWHGAELRVYRIRRDEKDLRVMRAAARAFLDRVEAGDAPDVDGHPATLGALRKVHPSIENVDVEVPVEFAEGYRRARALARRAEAAVDGYEARARVLLGNGRRLVCNGHLVASRSIYDQSGDTAELLALDGEPAVVDRLNPGRAASYLHPKGTKK